MELRNNINPPKVFGVDDEPAANIVRAVAPRPQSKPFNSKLPPAPFPSWDPDRNSGVLSQPLTNDKSVNRPGITENRSTQSIQNFGHIYHNNNKEITGIYINNSRYISEFLKFADSQCKPNCSHETHTVPCSDESISICLDKAGVLRSQARPINQNGALTNEVANKFKLLHPIFRSTIIRGAIEHYKISEDDIENEIATSLPYWLGIDENSAKCMLQDYMITSREPAFGEPGPKDLPDAISFLLQASLPLTLLYPWVDPKLATPSPDVSDRGNVDAFDSDSALDDSSTVIATLDSNSNTFSYLYYNHTYDSVESQCHINAPKSLQPSNYDRFLDSFNIPNNDYFNESGDIIECNDILEMENALYKGNKLDNISTGNTSQSKDLSAENKIYSDEYLNNDGVDLSDFPLLSSTCAPPATLTSAMAPKAQDIFCNDSLKAQEATFPNKLKGSLNITTQTPHYLSGSAPTTSWTDNDVLKSGMSISSNMAPNKYGDQNRFQGYSGCYFSQGYHYDTQQISNNAFKSTQVKGKAKAEPNTSIAAEATATSMTGAISQGESKGKAKVFDISNTTTAPANAASFYYPGLPPMYTFNSLQSNVQGESLSQACPPKRKRGRPRKDTSVVIDANGHAAIRATDNGPSHGAASARAENAIAGNKPKRAKKMAQPRAAPKMNAFVAASNARAAAQAARAAPISTTLGSTVDAAEGVVARDFAAKS